MTYERAAELLSKVTVLDDPEMEEAHKIEISALRAQQEQSPCSRCGYGGKHQDAPLTLDELRKMDGEPVWVQFLHNQVGYWDIIGCRNSEFLRFYRSGFLVIGEYGKNFLVYRHKPEERTV